MGVAIRRGVPGDAERLAALMFEDPPPDAVEMAGSAEGGQRFEVLLLRDAMATGRSVVLVAEVEEEPVGFAELGTGDIPPLRSVARHAVSALGLVGAVRSAIRSRARLQIELHPPAGSAHVVELQVSPRHRNHGIGRLLLDDVERLARQRKATHLSLTTRTTNPARRLYERAGFRLEAEDGGRVLYVKPLPGLRLRPLRPDDEAEFRAGHRALEESDDYAFGLWFDDTTDWPAYLDLLDRCRRAVRVPEGMVPSTFLVAEVAGEIVGRSSIRHELNEFLAHEGGHIGYAVLPGHRRQGYATEILRQSLVVARAAGVDRVLVTCDDVNEASARTIERCGGVFESLITDTRSGEPLRRYWID